MLTFGTYNLWNLDLPRTAVQKSATACWWR